MARRLSELDLPDRLAPVMPLWSSQMLIALGCTGLAFGVRALIDLFLPSAGPFALTFPSVLLATLFGRWQAGLLTQIFCALFAWYFVLPEHGSFRFEVPTDGPRVVVNFLSGLLIVLLAETFRRAVRRAVGEREEEVDRRDLYLREFDHRVKNNFAIIASLLDLQRRQLSGEAAQAIADAQARVASIARAHQSLYRGDGQPQRVEMSGYLCELAQSLHNGFLDGHRVDVRCEAETFWLDRDRAVSIGLLANELVTNAAKHAFVGREEGHITLQFQVHDDSLELAIEDDGVGMGNIEVSPDNLGQRLMKAFVKQAGGTLERTDLDRGTRFTVMFERSEDGLAG